MYGFSYGYTLRINNKIGEAMTVIKKCDCKHKYQDNKYGKGNRVQNTTLKEKFRCTVCGKENK